MNENHVINYSILESLQAQKNGDVFDHCGKFLIDIISSNDFYEPLNEVNAGNLFEEYLGVILPSSVVVLILNRLKSKHGAFDLKDSVFYPNREKIEELAAQFKEKKEKAIRETSKLIKSFIIFAEEKFQTSISEKEAENLILQYLKKYQVEIISFFSSSAVPQEQGKSIKNPDYLISRYLKEIYDSEPVLFEYFVNLFKGVIVSNFLISNPIRDNKDNLKNVTVYLDTPLLLGVFGFSGATRKRAIEEMIQLATKVGSHVKYFSITLSELENVIHAWAHDLEEKKFHKFRDSTLSVLRMNGWDHNFLRNFVLLLKSKLQDLQVYMESEPQIKTEYQIDYDGLRNKILEDAYGDYSGVDHDVKCIQNIFQLRKYQAKITFQDIVPIFITVNSLVINSVNSFFKDDVHKDSAPACANDVWFTNMCWMLAPDLFPNWPKHLIIANYQSVIHDDDSFWNDFLRRFKSLNKSGMISESDFELVRRENSLKQALKMLTVTKGLSYTNEDVLELVNKEKSKILRERDHKIQKLENKIASVGRKFERVLRWGARIVRYSVEFIFLSIVVFANYQIFKNQSEVWFFIVTILTLVLSYTGVYFSKIGFKLEQVLLEKFKRLTLSYLNR